MTNFPIDGTPQDKAAWLRGRKMRLSEMREPADADWGEEGPEEWDGDPDTAEPSARDAANFLHGSIRESKHFGKEISAKADKLNTRNMHAAAATTHEAYRDDHAEAQKAFEDLGTEDNAPKAEWHESMKLWHGAKAQEHWKKFDSAK